MKPLVQISPAYPPDISGVGDYAALLETAFSDLGCQTATLVMQGKEERANGGVRALQQADADALEDALANCERVLLHFSGYGYARRGLCRWLADGLARWKAGDSGRRLVTMFHEVYATGPIWRSSFWTAGQQRRIARDLARLSDSAFVSSQGGFDQVRQLRPELPLSVLPVFSNVGEPDALRPLAEREPCAVVFGGRERRKRVYTALRDERQDVGKNLERLGIREIIDIGPELELPSKVAGCVARPLGKRPAEEVSAVLADSRIGFIDYPGHVFTKSGIAAAYFAHRVMTVNTSSVAGFPPELEEGRQFVGLATFVQQNFAAQAVADAGLGWYRPHNVAATGHMLAEQLL